MPFRHIQLASINIPFWNMSMSKTIYSQERKYLSARLVRATSESGLTQSEVSTAVSISQTELSKMENGQRRVEFLVLIALAELYVKKVDFLCPRKLVTLEAK